MSDSQGRQLGSWRLTRQKWPAILSNPYQRVSLVDVRYRWGCSETTNTAALSLCRAVGVDLHAPTRLRAHLFRLLNRSSLLFLLTRSPCSLRQWKNTHRADRVARHADEAAGKALLASSGAGEGGDAPNPSASPGPLLPKDVLGDQDVATMEEQGPQFRSRTRFRCARASAAVSRSRTSRPAASSKT